MEHILTGAFYSQRMISPALYQLIWVKKKSLEIVPQRGSHTEQSWYLIILRADGEECLKSCVSSGLTKAFQNIIKY